MVKVSVVIPVYNSGKYLRQTLDSVLGQSLREIEIICVNDGSTDDSLSILEEYAAKDSRLTVRTQKNKGAAAARNAGMKLAQGQYLSILDADDWFESGMLEKAYRKCEQDHADICVFRSDRFDAQTLEYTQMPETIREELLPKTVPFKPRDIYPYAFQVFIGWSWDKLYRRDMVAGSGLKFQNLRTTNDAFFVFLMTLQAGKITLVDEVLAHHRDNLAGSLSATRQKSWDCCWKAVWAIQRELKKRGWYVQAEQSFVNWALNFLLWNVYSIPSDEVKEKLTHAMQARYFKKLGFGKYPESYFYYLEEYQEYQNICKLGRTGAMEAARQESSREAAGQESIRKTTGQESGKADFGIKRVKAVIQSMGNILLEHKQNIRLLVKMAFLNMDRQTVRSSLGMFWTYFHDIIYILVFVAFRILMAGSGSIMGMDSTVYMMTGMIPWFFLNDVLSQGSMAIRSSKGIVQSIRFPVPVLPTVEVLSIFLKRIFSFAMLFAVVTAFGYIRYFNLPLFLYYVACALALAAAMNLVVSAFVAVSDDFRQLYDALLRVLIYTMPILWDFSNVGSLWINILLRINPMVYVVKGFRDAFVLGPAQDAAYTAYFWACVFVIFLAGSYVQDRLKKYYADFV